MFSINTVSAGCNLRAVDSMYNLGKCWAGPSSFLYIYDVMFPQQNHVTAFLSTSLSALKEDRRITRLGMNILRAAS